MFAAFHLLDATIGQSSVILPPSFCLVMLHNNKKPWNKFQGFCICKNDLCRLSKKLSLAELHIV